MFWGSQKRGPVEMLGFETDKRFGLTRDVAQYRHDVEDWSNHDEEDWKSRHDELVRVCWAGENFIAKANFHFSRIMQTDLNIQKLMFNCPDADPDLLHMVRDLATGWLQGAVSMRDSAKRLLSEFGTIEGMDELEANIEAMQSFLTPDAEFFDSEELAEARDQAIESHRAGLTEPLLNNGYSTQ
jgi:hypothetical protein